MRIGINDARSEFLPLTVLYYDRGGATYYVGIGNKNSLAIDEETRTAEFNRRVFRRFGNAGLYLVKYFVGFFSYFLFVFFT